jgi:hypothetical protein
MLDSSKSTKLTRPQVGLVGIALLLGIGAAGSVVGLMYSRGHGGGLPMLWFGLLVGAFLFGGLLCLFFKLVRAVDVNGRERSDREHAVRHEVDSEYVAEYSISNRGVAVGLALFLGVLSARLLLRSSGVVACAGCGALFCWSVYYAVHVNLTQIRFTQEGVVARMPLLRQVSEPYGSISRLYSKPGTLSIEFADGQSLKIHSGLGEAGVIIGYLREHCPPSVYTDAG